MQLLILAKLKPGIAQIQANLKTLIKSFSVSYYYNSKLIILNMKQRQTYFLSWFDDFITVKAALSSNLKAFKFSANIR